MQMAPSRGRQSSAGRDFSVLGLIALSLVVLHLFTNGQYGFHRDELQTLDDARHLAWGYVAYPPVTPFIEHVAWSLFGLSLVGLRLFSALGQGVAVVLTGWMARELGGGRLAQIVAALAAAFAPFALFQGTEFQYSSFDDLWWVLIAYLMIHLLKSENPRWWLGVGAVIGLGMMTKYAIIFFVAAIVGGVLLTPTRRDLRSPWLWCGAALSLLIFLPNLIWQIHHDFISLDFLHSIHARDIHIGRTSGFLRDQFTVSTNPLTVPLWMAGLFYFFVVPEGKRYRLIGWMFVISFAALLIGKGRGYYLAPAHPMLFAAGSVLEECWLSSLAAVWSRFVRGVTFSALAAAGVISGAIILPMAPVSSPKNIAIKINGDLREEVGWTELAHTVAGIRDSLPAEERANLGILAGNYGEAGAIDLYGPAYGLPRAISGTNSYWLRGYDDPPPQTLIVVGLSGEIAERVFQSCRLAGHNTNPYGIKNEESTEHPDIFVCGAPRKSWPEFWLKFKSYG
jgi:4-amino-4-deoxy-L-arabinose transferase-like glycosyltransferase